MGVGGVSSTSRPTSTNGLISPTTIVFPHVQATRHAEMVAIDEYFDKGRDPEVLKTTTL